ncbi:hypothetical protein [Citrobacter braakii]|uniref:hypothetical protein n=1 Tax=Citrobacter braakii TaxID=57706 RepID=UPI0039767DBB
MDNGFITKELGEKHPYPEELFEIAMKFTMAFYYCEKHFFSRFCNIRNSDHYSKFILDIVKDDCNQAIADVFEYFKGRYVNGDRARERLHALTMQEEGEDLSGWAETIDVYLNRAEGDVEAMLSVCLMVIIRLRHNLLHANKYEVMSGEPKEQEVLIGKGYSLLSSLLSARNKRTAV